MAFRASKRQSRTKDTAGRPDVNPEPVPNTASLTVDELVGGPEVEKGKEVIGQSLPANRNESRDASSTRDTVPTPDQTETPPTLRQTSAPQVQRPYSGFRSGVPSVGTRIGGHRRPFGNGFFSESVGVVDPSVVPMNGIV